MLRVDYNRLLSLLVQHNMQVNLLLNLQLLLNVDAIYNVPLLLRLLVNIFLTKHQLCRLFDITDRVNSMDTPMEAILFEVAPRASLNLDLRLDHKLALIVNAEGTCNIEGLLGAKSDVAEGNGHAVLVHHLGRLVLVQLHGAQCEGAHQVLRLAWSCGVKEVVDHGWLEFCCFCRWVREKRIGEHLFYFSGLMG